MLLHKELLFMAEGTPHVTMQRITTFECSVGVLALVRCVVTQREVQGELAAQSSNVIAVKCSLQHSVCVCVCVCVCVFPLSIIMIF